MTRAYAKINLALDVLGKRADGYHDLEGVMHSIDLFDEVRTAPASFDVTVTCSEDIPRDNTAYRAAKLYLDRSGIHTGLNIHIDKHIPSQAGLGGASADAACVLTELNLRYGAFSDDELYAMAKSVGADVPFCLHGGCSYASGIGEILEDLPPQNLHILLVKGDRGIPTGELFSRHDSLFSDKAADARLACLRRACTSHDRDLLCASVFNTLEEAAFDYLPELAQTKEVLRGEGAIAALMTGSGSCIYGIFDTESAVLSAEKKLTGRFSFVKSVRLTGRY